MATILVVDDDIPILDLLTEMLEDCGHATLRAVNGQEALALALAHRPDIIITDIMMPVMDGYELLKAVRGSPSLARTCVILASAGVSALHASSAPLPPDGYMPKPFTFGDVEHVVQATVAA